MGQAILKPKMTGDEYLAWEAEQPEKHDFVNGEVYALAGAERGHVTTAGNAYMALRQHLTGSPCRTYIADMKVQAQEGDQYFYPDVVVTCSTADRSSPLVVREPTLIVEVLSPSTLPTTGARSLRTTAASPHSRRWPSSTFIPGAPMCTGVGRMGCGCCTRSMPAMT